MKSIVFKDKVGIVTGAGEGIGRQYALDLAKRGVSVVVNDIGYGPDHKRTADQVVDEINNAGGRAVANYDSVATMAGGCHIVETAMDHFGKVDILINNAGVLRDKTFMKMSEQEWDEVILVHLKGAFCVTQPAVKMMKKNQYGRIVFTASSSGMYGNFGQSNYGAAKMGIIGIMNTLKLEIAKYNIQVNVVAPNALTGMTQGVFPDKVAKRIKPEFNAPIVTFLCSEENLESGMIFTMSAGWYARSAMVSGKGVCIGDANRVITAEEVRDNFDQIKSIENALPYEDCSQIYTLGKSLTGR